MKYLTYRVIMEPDENNTFHGYAPALSGCHTWGESIEEIKKNMKEAIELYVADLVQTVTSYGVPYTLLTSR